MAEATGPEASADTEAAPRQGRWNRASRGADNLAVSAASTSVQPGATPAAGSENTSGGRSTWRAARGLARDLPDVEVVESPTQANSSTPLSHAVDSESPAPLSREGPVRAGLGCTIRLRRGLSMPQLGLGGGSLDGPPGRDAVAAALLGGYRLIDTALFYGNEADIAAGIRQAGLKRRDVFIATKLLQKAHVSTEKVRASLQESLKNLSSNYVDLYMIHNPRAGRILKVWPVLQELRDQGVIRVLGVSNFGIAQLEGMRLAGLELPEVNQIEIHCWRQLPEVVEYHQRHSIATMCMAPLARSRLLGQTDLATIAASLGRSEAEVAIRWSLQRGFIPIPKSIRPERILSNAADGFDLTEKDMERIAKLDTGYMSCTVASPCHELAWELVADAIPDPAIWGGKKPTGTSGKGYGRSNEFGY